MIIDTTWIKGRIKDLGKTQEDLGKRLGVSAGAVSRLVQNDRDIKLHEIEIISKFLELSFKETLSRFGVDVEANGAQQAIPFIGWVDGSDVIHNFAPDDKKTVASIRDLPPRTVAIQVREANCNNDGFMYFYQPLDGIDANAFGRLSVVKIEGDDNIYVKRILRGYDDETFRLLSLCGAVEEEKKIESASPILWIIP